MTSKNKMAQLPDRPLTIGRPELLSGGTDVNFRKLLHGLMSYGRMINDIRSYFGVLLGVSGVQYEILMAIQRLGGSHGVSVRDVASWIRRSPVFVTNEVKHLEEKRLVNKAKDLDDRRKVLLRLTPESAARIAGLAPVQREINDLLFEDMSAAEFQMMVNLVERLLPCGERALRRIDMLNL